MAYKNRIQFLGLVVYMWRNDIFVVPKITGHQPFLAFRKRTASDTNWPIKDLPKPGGFEYVDLYEEHIEFVGLEGDLDQHGNAYLPRLSRCCPKIEALRADIPLAAQVHLTHGDVGWSGDAKNDEAICTIVTAYSTNLLQIVSGKKSLKFKEAAEVVIANIETTPEHGSHKDHFRRYYKCFEGASNCDATPSGGGLCSAGENTNRQDCIINPNVYGAEIDCSNSQYP